MTEIGKTLTHCLKAMDVSTGISAAIYLTVGEDSQKMELLDFLADNRDATPEELLDEARRISGR